MTDAPALPVGPGDLVFACRMCTKMAEQIAQGATHCQLALCGGPRRGLAFPLYAGPLTDGWFKQNCYMCGQPAAKKLRVKPLVGRAGRDLAVCLKCLPRIGPEATS